MRLVGRVQVFLPRGSGRYAGPMSTVKDHGLDAAVSDLRQARSVLVLTGAGLSADSGLPTYRGVGGLYEGAVTEDGLPIEQALSGDTMRTRPEISWKYIRQIEAACRGCVYNAAHAALVRMQARFDRFTVLTQNVDGFHRAAGTRDLIEIHGNIHDLQCTLCGFEARVDDYAHIEPLPPKCRHCGSVIRPRVVLFGELLPEGAVARLEAVVRQGVDCVMVVGTTAVFPYIAAPVVHAARSGKPTIEINPGDSEVSPVVKHRLRARAVDVLPRLAAALT